MEKSLTNIIKELNSFATRHKQISSFRSEPITENTAKGLVYPVMFIDVQLLNVAFQEGQAVISAPIYFIDRIKNDYSNLVNVMSASLLKIDDFLTYFYDREDELKFSLQLIGNATPVIFEFDDLCAGYLVNVSIQTRMVRNENLIPIE